MVTLRKLQDLDKIQLGIKDMEEKKRLYVRLLVGVVPSTQTERR